MSLPIAFDITHLTSRCEVQPHTGIDRVDIALATAFSTTNSAAVLGLNCGVFGANLVPQPAISRLVRKAKAAGASVEADEATKGRIRTWFSTTNPERTIQAPEYPSPRRLVNHALQAAPWQQLRWLSHRNRGLTIPNGAIYLNAAPHGMPDLFCFKWLDRRSDIKAVFFIHDLLPLDYPEFFPAEWLPRFRQLTFMIMKRANGIIVASHTMRERVELELARHNRNKVPILVAPLPPPPAFLCEPKTDEIIQKYPYFVSCGTIEPRKNHLLLLNIWRRFSEQGNDAYPSLVLIGKRGWENDQTTAILDRSVQLRRVLEVRCASDRIHHWLLSNAVGALYPSFAEGYGLPVVESLSLGLPTVASDIPVLREVTQNCAVFCDPSNADAWRSAVANALSRSTATWKPAMEQARAFRAPATLCFVDSIIEFLRSL
jgi:glycosyltransferase involved in cell wall biosynthesis